MTEVSGVPEKVADENSNLQKPKNTNSEAIQQMRQKVQELAQAGKFDKAAQITKNLNVVEQKKGL